MRLQQYYLIYRFSSDGLVCDFLHFKRSSAGFDFSVPKSKLNKMYDFHMVNVLVQFAAWDEA